MHKHTNILDLINFTLLAYLSFTSQGAPRLGILYYHAYPVDNVRCPKEVWFKDTQLEDDSNDWLSIKILFASVEVQFFVHHPYEIQLTA